MLVIIWNLGIGGVQKRIKDIAFDMTENHPHWQIILLVKNRQPQCFNHLLESLSNVTIHYFSSVDSITHDRIIRRSPLPWILTHIYLYNPTVCLSFLSHFSLLLVLYRLFVFWRKPIIVLNEVSQTTNYLHFHSSHPNMEKWLIRLFYRFADKIITPSKAGAKDLQQNYWVPPKKLTVIPNWTLFPPTEPSKKIYDLMYIGRFEPEKNISALIETVLILKKSFPHLRLALVGEGSLEMSLKETVKELSLNQNIVYLKTTSNLMSLLKQAKIFVIASQSEGLPNVVLEAGMGQIPTIANHFAGAEEVILHGKTGYLTNSPKEMAAFISRILSHTSITNQLGKAAEKYILQNFHKKTQDLFIQTLIKSA